VSELPKGWTYERAADVCTKVQSGGTPKTGFLKEPGIPFLKVYNIVGQEVRFEDRPQFVSVAQQRGSLAKSVTLPGDVLMNIVGPPLGKVAVVPDQFPEWNINQALTLFRPSSRISTGWLYWTLCGGQNLSDVIHETKGSAGQVNISLSQCREFILPVPPSSEQSRIVAKIEALMGRSHTARECLAEVPHLLEQYRQSVLAAAFRGELTEEWRVQHSKSTEHANALLQRVETERRACSQGNGKYPQCTSVDLELLPQLPPEWTWTHLREIAALKGGIAKGNKRTGRAISRPVPYLRVANVQRGYLNLNEILNIEATEKEINELRLISGDILFNEGGDRDKLGRGWVWQGQINECIHQNHVFRGRLYDQNWDPRLISHWGNAFGQKYFQDEGKQTTNLASISLSKLGDLPVPVIPLAEQRALIDIISKRLEIIDDISEVVKQLARNFSDLERSILNRAFCGELFTTDEEGV
jgi:type I restriction enzyme S subunit